MPKTVCAAALLAVLAAFAAAPAVAQTKSQPRTAPKGPAVALTLEAVSVHLFLEGSGTLSGDATGTPGISGANMRAMLPGDKTEPFHDFLVKVTLGAKGEAFARGRQATVSIIDVKTKRAIETHGISDVYIGADGRIVKAIWVRDRMCQALEVRVTAGPKTISRQLNFHCGE